MALFIIGVSRFPLIVFHRNMACKWVIRSDHSHEVIKLEVIDSQLQGSPTCGEDFGEVKDGRFDSESSR